ncbi:hypothetical protein [Ancylobacter pratisalsi]|uniref:Uncharacterized protein n=1 Tax=Ancylobacter pratisalsi TaxID=1745854 RepID=A0A6P1YMC4_9HYPH|nr:hypothetical protein [Ancylobacter pratisalsi]QIB34469.1 hypothetical protein G3A50_12675 [Ancylobacter pratisalsi]
MNGGSRLCQLGLSGVLVLFLGPAALAQEAPASSPVAAAERANFSIQPVEGGVMKLDTRSGAMSFCSQRADARPGAGVSGSGAGSWVCEAVPEDRAALEAEIGRLQARIAALEKARTGVTPGVPDIMVPPEGGAGSSTHPPPQAAVPDDDAKLTEDARRKLDEAMDMAEHVFKRFLGMVDRLRGENKPSQGEPL